MISISALASTLPAVTGWAAFPANEKEEVCILRGDQASVTSVAFFRTAS